jgi:hypothetical protein
MTDELVNQYLAERKRSLALTTSQHYSDTKEEKGRSY